MLARSRRGVVAVLAAAVVALTAGTGAPASAAPAAVSAAAAVGGRAPVVALLSTEGRVQVDCGPLTSGSRQYRVDYQREGGRTSSTTLPRGASTVTLTLALSATYTVTCRERSFLFWGSPSAPTTVRYPDLTLPVVRIDTADAAPVLDRDTYLSTTVTVEPNGQAGVPALSTTGRIRGRGNSTWNVPSDKKPYKLKLDAKQSFLGMPAAKDWGLLANYYDRTMMRTAIAYAWGSATSLAWTPRTVFVEVVLNGDYRGVYQASELVEVGSSRVAVDELSDADTTLPALAGGYLAELDYKAQGPYAQPDDVVDFNAALSGAPFTIKDPEPPVPAQVDYLRSQVDAAESAILATSGSTGPEPWAAVERAIDPQSYADWYLVSEMARNYDAWYSSTYMVKPRQGRLSMGPLWDFDLSMGTYFLKNDQPSNDAWVRARSPWNDYLLRTPQYFSLVQQRWAALRPTVTGTPALIDSLDARLRTARSEDQVRWGYREDLRSEVSFLRSWVASRTTFMDASYGTGA